MEIPESCEGCPRIKPRLEAIERAEARKTSLAKNVSQFMGESKEARNGILAHEELLEGLDEEYRAEIEEEIEGVPEQDLVEWLMKPLEKRAAERLEESFELNERIIEMERNCIFILLRGCMEGVQIQQGQTEGGEVDCSSANISLAIDHSTSFANSLWPTDQ